MTALFFIHLGILSFDQYWSTETQEQLSIGIVFDDTEEDMETEVYFFPMKSEKSQVSMMDGEQLTEWNEEFITYGEYSDDVKDGIREGMIDNDDF